jgi:hypothetical protein
MLPRHDGAEAASLAPYASRHFRFLIRDRDAKSTSGMPVPCSSSTPATATPTGRIGLSTRLLPYCHFPSPRQTGPTASDGRTGSVDSSTSISRWHEMSRVSGTHRVDEVEAGYCSA